MTKAELSVFTLNCWGLRFSGKRRERITAIGQYLSSSLVDYDIVGLQEVWLLEDFSLIKDTVKGVFPHATHWVSGLSGSGLAILSKYPFLGTSLNRYTLNGDPSRFLHGDWYDGKGCASAIIIHPRFGEIQVFDTHLHATYDPKVTQDVYLGCRLAQAWEMAQLIRTAISLGRHVIAMGDFNSAPDSLVIQVLTRYAGLNDSWGELHPFLSQPFPPPPNGLSPEEGISLLGITCDTPLNTWTSGSRWPNSLTKDPIGERLDYILYNDSYGVSCLSSQVVLQEKTQIGGPKSMKHMSDHFGLHSVFTVNQDTPHPRHDILSQELTEDNVDLLENVLVALEQHLILYNGRSKKALIFIAPILSLVIALLVVAVVQIDSQTSSVAKVSLSIGLVVASLSLLTSVLYSLIYGGETISAFTNVIQEIQSYIK
ncbi:phospholipase C type enzyme [Entomortierella beljakovae]|nr:phospholipase C type enzyme [Entomortierella beljakovae]